MNNNSGIILFVVLWTLVILGALAVSMGRSTNIDLAITKNVVGKLKSKYIAIAGLSFAQNQILLDTQDGGSKDQDTLYLCGISLGQGSPESLFKDVKIGEGRFNIFSELQDSDKVHYGFQDEERKINLNTLTESSVSVLVSLLTFKGIDFNSAQSIAYSVLDWRDEDSVMKQSYSAEDLYYMNLSKNYHCKNAAFDTVEELLFVRGVTPKIYQNIKKLVTIYPKSGSFNVNFETASEDVLIAVARSASGSRTNTSESDADSLVRKMIEYRRGDDEDPFTADDRVIDPLALGMNASENVIYQVIDQYRTTTSNYFRVFVEGIEEVRNTRTQIEAVIERESLSIVYWNQN